MLKEVKVKITNDWLERAQEELAYFDSEEELNLSNVLEIALLLRVIVDGIEASDALVEISRGQD